jgi:hypothetical protein
VAQRSIGFPESSRLGSRLIDGRGDPGSVGSSQAASYLKSAQGAVESHVNEVADPQRIEDKRVGAAFRHTQAHAVQHTKPSGLRKRRRNELADCVRSRIASRRR